MSTLLFANSTSTRLAKPAAHPAAGNLSTTFVTAVAALVPAEALIVQAAVLQVTTTTTEASGKNPATTVISHPSALGASFWALLVLSAVAYLAIRWTSDQRFRLLDVAGVLIAPAAYVVWSLLQSPSAFEAAFKNTSQFGRETTGYILAGFILILAPVFSYSVGQAKPKPRPRPAAG